MKGRTGPAGFRSFFLPGVPVAVWKSPQALWDLVMLTFLLVTDTGLLLPDRHMAQVVTPAPGRLRHEDCYKCEASLGYLTRLLTS